MKPEVVFENEQLIAFSKPSGLLSIPDRFDAQKENLLRLAESRYGKLFVVHRIDKDTSGLIVFAKDEDTHRFMSGLFLDRGIEKYYLALVQGNPVQAAGSIRKGIMPHPTLKGKMVVNAKGKEARTDYEVLQNFSGFSLVKLQIFTGRTHQIRVHMHDLGYPVVCDPLYGKGSPVYLSAIKKKFKLSINELEEQPMLQRLALHAFELRFKDASGQEIHIQAPLSKDMNATVKQLEKWAK